MFSKLKNTPNTQKYYVGSAKPFEENTVLKKEDIEKSFDFAYRMTFGGEGYHRPNRTNSKKTRKMGEIFIDAFQGKLSEFAFYNFAKQYDSKVSEPNIDVEGKNLWDNGDFSFRGKDLSVKSTKYYGDLLLLEKSDWTEKGEYIPNVKVKKKPYTVDYFVLFRVKPDGSSIMKKAKLLYRMRADRAQVKDVIMKEEWSCNLVGCITRRDFLKLIKYEFVLPKGALLNGRKKIQVDNYYVQSGEMRDIAYLIENT